MPRIVVLAILNRAVDERGQGMDGISMAAHERIVDDRVMAGAQQFFDDDAADIAGATGN